MNTADVVRLVTTAAGPHNPQLRPGKLIHCRVWAPGCTRLATSTVRRRHSRLMSFSRDTYLVPTCESCRRFA